MCIRDSNGNNENVIPTFAVDIAQPIFAYENTQTPWDQNVMATALRTDEGGIIADGPMMHSGTVETLDHAAASPAQPLADTSNMLYHPCRTDRYFGACAGATVSHGPNFTSRNLASVVVAAVIQSEHEDSELGYCVEGCMSDAGEGGRAAMQLRRMLPFIAQPRLQVPCT
eukprot:3039411-Rhodomonas_salina.2